MVCLLRFGFMGVACSVVVLAMVGCGSDSSFPEGPTGTLSGTVTLDDMPVPAGTSVTFIHTKTSQPATAVVEQDGTYTAKMHGQPKVLAGEYQVTLADTAEPTPTPEEMAAQMEAAYTGEAEDKPTGVVPAKYNLPETSGLTAVVAEGPNTFGITMFSK